MDPVVVALLILFIGLPVLSAIVMLAFAATADFEPEGVEVRGGTLRGAIASALAKILVGDAKTFQLPLVVTLRKVGIFGASTPLIGGATVRDIEWRIYVDDEHVSTVTEAASVPVSSTQRVLQLPVNAEVHLPRGLVGTWRKYRQDKRAGREVKIEVRGHVIVKHWLMTREMPVRVARRVVVGAVVPRVEVRWSPVGPEPANAAVLSVRASNPYHEEVLEAPVALEVVAHRRLRRDPVLAVHHETVRLDPGEAKAWSFRVRLEPSVRAAGRSEQVVVHEVHPRIRWDDESLPMEVQPLRLSAADLEDEPLVARLDPSGHHT